VHIAATIAFNNSHIARVINTWHRPNQNKNKDKENTFLLCKVFLQSNESLNTPSLPSSPYFLHSCRGSWLFISDIHCSHGPVSMSVNVSTISSASCMWFYHFFSQGKQIQVSSIILLPLPTRIFQHPQYKCIYTSNIKVRNSLKGQ
jgi:hypothetical protein